MGREWICWIGTGQELFQFHSSVSLFQDDTYMYVIDLVPQINNNIQYFDSRNPLFPHTHTYCRYLHHQQQKFCGTLTVLKSNDWNTEVGITALWHYKISVLYNHDHFVLATLMTITTTMTYWPQRSKFEINHNINKTNHKFAIELVCKQWIWQLTEVQFQQWAHAVNVTYVNVIIQ